MPLSSCSGAARSGCSSTTACARDEQLFILVTDVCRRLAAPSSVARSCAAEVQHTQRSPSNALPPSAVWTLRTFSLPDDRFSLPDDRPNEEEDIEDEEDEEDEEAA